MPRRRPFRLSFIPRFQGAPWPWALLGLALALPLLGTLALLPAPTARASEGWTMAADTSPPPVTPPPIALPPLTPPSAGAPSPTPNPQPPPAPQEDVLPPKGGKVVPGVAPPRPRTVADLPMLPTDPDARREWLRSKLDELFGAAWLAKAKVSVLVVEADTGRSLYARSDKTLLNAASNVKIVTSAAALALLGPEYRWKTTLSAPGPANGPPVPPGGELKADLYLRGFGDPTLGTQDLGAMVSDLAALGLHKVAGGIVVDESFFDRVHVGPAYEQKNESYASRAPSSGASLNGNVVAVTVVPGTAAGIPARVVVEPSSAYFTVAGRVITAADGPASLSIETQDDGGGRTRIAVAGRVRLGTEPRTIYRRVIDPPLYLGHTLKQLLERRGISVAKPVRLGPAPAQGLRVLSAHESPPMGVAVHDLNKRSNNFAAEQVVRTLGAEIVGRPGTWEKGIEAVSRFLASAGVKRGNYQMMNGAGLYDSNRFSAEQIVAVLRAANRDFRISAEFLSSLAVAGTDGTIAHRMGSTLAERYVRAKTGTLANASCLSGFAGSPGHVPLVFSILMNDIANAWEARRIQDRAAELLVAYLEADSPARP